MTNAELVARHANFRSTVKCGALLCYIHQYLDIVIFYLVLDVYTDATGSLQICALNIHGSLLEFSVTDFTVANFQVFDLPQHLSSLVGD